VDKPGIVGAIRAERARSIMLLRGLAPSQWDTPTALPGWRVREVVAHLVSVDRASVTGQALTFAFSSTHKLEAWNDRAVPAWADRSIPALLDALDRWGRRFAILVRVTPSAAYRVRVPTQWGRQHLSLLLWVRAYDEWVHRQDIRRALDLGDEDDGVDPIAQFLLTMIARETLRHVDAGRGSVALSLGGRQGNAWIYDLAARAGRPAPNPPDADARVEATATAFIMAAAGRDGFADLESTGALSIEGDRAVADALLSRLRIV
jgi:uncharacterized protein (TIGR03083 family)